MTFTSCPNRKSKFNITKNHISTTARGKFTIFALLYRSLILKKIFTKRWPQFDLYFLSKPEVKVEYLLKNHISTTARGKFTICALLYRSLILKKYLQKSDPNLTFTSCPNRKSKFTIKTIISQQPQEVNSNFAPLYRSLIVKKYLQKVTPIWPLLPVQTGSQSLISLQKSYLNNRKR